MQYLKSIMLKNGKECMIRNAETADAAQVLSNFLLTHEETDFLYTYPDECSLTEETEAQFLEAKKNSLREIELVAVIDGYVAGTAGVDAIGGYYKTKHRAEVGLNVEKAFWGLGIGRELLRSCIECAKEAGFSQLELSVVEENERAVMLYQREGFIQYGRNPRGFISRKSGDQPLVMMYKSI